MNIKLIPLQEHEKETFIRNISTAFLKAAVEQFDPFDEEIIPRDHVIHSFEAEGAESYNILLGGAVQFRGLLLGEYILTLGVLSG